MVPNLVGKIYKLKVPLYKYSLYDLSGVAEEAGSIFKVLEMIEKFDIEAEANIITNLKVYFFKSKETFTIPFELDSIELLDTEMSQLLFE